MHGPSSPACDKAIAIPLRHGYEHCRGLPCTGSNHQGAVISQQRYTGHTALVLEDNFIIGLAFKVQLEDMGFQVLGPAATLGDARALLAQATPDIALLDVNLGHESSNDLAHELIASKVPVVFVTGYDSTRGLDAALADTPCIRKPIDPVLLQRALDRALRT